MTPEQSVVSLELGREMEKRKILVDSYWLWGLMGLEDEDPNKGWEVVVDNDDTFDSGIYKFVPAPQTDELLAVLPNSITTGGFKYYFSMMKDWDATKKEPAYIAGYNKWENTQLQKRVDIRPVDSLAKLLIYLHDNNLLDLTANLHEIEEQREGKE